MLARFHYYDPSGQFTENRRGDFSFEGKINGVRIEVSIKATGTLRYSFQAEVKRAKMME